MVSMLSLTLFVTAFVFLRTSYAEPQVNVSSKRSQDGSSMGSGPGEAATKYEEFVSEENIENSDGNLRASTLRSVPKHESESHGHKQLEDSSDHVDDSGLNEIKVEKGIEGLGNCKNQCFSEDNCFTPGCRSCIGGFCRPAVVCPVCSFSSQCPNTQCPECINGRCQPGGNRNGCGAACNTFNNFCNPTLGCPDCINGICRPRGSRTCAIQNEAELRAKIQVGGTHLLCPDFPITVTTAIHSSASNVRLQCAQGTLCKVKAGAGNQIFNLSGTSWTVQGITFESGGYGSNVSQGGAFYLSGSGPSFTFNNCQFTNNRATQSGGAVYSNQGGAQFNSCTFSGNYAPTCPNVYLGGTCFNASDDAEVKTSMDVDVYADASGSDVS